MSNWKVTQRGRVVATPTADDARAVFFVWKVAARAGTVTTLHDDAGHLVERHEAERATTFKRASGTTRAPRRGQLALFA